MHQPYPTGNAAAVGPARPSPPASVVMAARLMYAGAVATALTLAATLADTGTLRAALHRSRPGLSAAELHTAMTTTVVFEVMSAILYIGLWIGMSVASRSGRNWARIVSTVLFAINTVLAAIGLQQPLTGIERLLSVLTWLIGLAAVVLLWRRESSAFYASAARP